jgi:hypothetical protein
MFSNFSDISEMCLYWITVNRSFEDVAKLKNLGTCMHEEIKSRLNSGHTCYHSVQSFVFPPAV